MINIFNIFKKEISLNDFYLNNKELLETLQNKESLYKKCLKEKIRLISYENGKLLFKTDEDVHIETDKYYWIFQQIFLEKNYQFPHGYKPKQYSVFEVGSNRGESTLWFAKNKECVKIYGFEIDPDTFKLTQRNRDLNTKLKDKIELYNFGLSDFNDDNFKLNFIPNEDSVSTIEEYFVNDYYNESRKERLKYKTVKIKSSSEVINGIIQKDNIKHDLVLEVDAEGSEYKILADLDKSGILSKFSVIFGECHKGMDGIHEILDKNFKLMHIDKISEQLSNFCFVRL